MGSLLTALRAQAWVEESKSQVLYLHRALFERAAADHTGAARILTINGAQFLLQSGGSKLPQERVVQQLEERCSQPVGNTLVPNTIVDRGETEAFVVCFAPKDELEGSALLATMERMARGADLSELGQFEGTYVKQTQSGGSVLLAWRPLGSVSLDRMFPGEGDAPGRDLDGVPRPRGRRLFSAALDGRSLIGAYETQAPQVREMATRLERAGYRVYGQDAAAAAKNHRGESSEVEPLMAQDEKRSILLVDSTTPTGHILVLVELP